MFCCFIPFVYVSVFVPVPYCFYCCSFVIYFEIRKYTTSSFVLSPQDFIGYLGPFVVPHKFWIFFLISVKNAIGILMRVASNLQMTLGYMDITILILPTHGHGICNLFVSLISFSSLRVFVRDLSLPWLNLFPKYFIVFYAIVNGIVSFLLKMFHHYCIEI